MLIELLDRSTECQRVREILDGAREGRGAALVVQGEAGIGKSALCEWAERQAPDMRVLTIGAVEPERTLPFAGLSDLVRGALPLLEALPDPQRRALEKAVARSDGPPGDRFAIGAAVLSLLGLLALDEPTLVVVDDAHWLDAASADALLFAARRLEREAVALIVAARPGSVFDPERSKLPCLRLRGLGAAASEALLADRHPELAPAVSAWLTQQTRGNPLALLEVPSVLTGEQLRGEERIDDPIPVGPMVERAMLERAANLQPSVRTAVVVAASSSTASAKPVLEALAVLGFDPGLLGKAEASGILMIEGGRIEFEHPLLRAVVYHRADGPERRAAHAALAQVTGDEVRAWHLARSTVGEDESVALALHQVGLCARERGAPAAAFAAFAEAARLSGAPTARVNRLTEAARDAHLAGEPASALRFLDQALAAGPEGVERADVQHVRGRILVMQAQREKACRLLVDEARRVRDADLSRAATMLAEASLHAFVSADVGQALVIAKRARRLATGTDTATEVFTAAMVALVETLGGDRVAASDALTGALPILRQADPLSEAGIPITLAAQSLFWLERHQPAAELLDRLIGAARRAGAPSALLPPLCPRAELNLRTGRWTIAATELEEAVRLAEEMGQSVHGAYALECSAWLAAATGDQDGCRAYAQRATTLIDEEANELGRLYILGALGLLELGARRVDRAIGHLEAARDLAARHELREPNVVHWMPDLIEAYVRAGDRRAAVAALGVFAEQARRSGGSWALGTAARCEGLLADGSADVDCCFTASLEYLERAANPFEVARTHLCRGERLRRGRRPTEARSALTEAIDGFDDLGAAPWSRWARAELRATGAVRRRDSTVRDELSAHELRVARIVSTGITNQQVAAALFISPKTVEFHLANIYRKLGVRSRTELAAVAARRGWLEASSAGD